ncbi:hypothetical protein ACOMHN_016405 [Nucella lapillus]
MNSVKPMACCSRVSRSSYHGLLFKGEQIIVPRALHSGFQDELSEANGLLFKGEQIIVPRALHSGFQDELSEANGLLFKGEQIIVPWPAVQG